MRAAFLKEEINSYNLLFVGVVLAGAAIRAVYLKKQINPYNLLFFCVVLAGAAIGVVHLKEQINFYLLLFLDGAVEQRILRSRLIPIFYCF